MSVSLQQLRTYVHANNSYFSVHNLLIYAVFKASTMPVCYAVSVESRCGTRCLSWDSYVLVTYVSNDGM